MTVVPRSSVSPVPTRRLEFIDLLRGWAVIVMIETHVVNATLTQAILESDPFQYVKFLNGLVAPSFLFASGLAFAVTTRRKLSNYLAFGPKLTKQFGRLLFVLLIGYILHLPKFSLSKLLTETTEGQWQIFMQADVLHCIAVSLLILQVLLLILKTERKLYTVTGVLTLAILFATPVMWGVDFWTILPWPFAAYMNGLRFSQFPLFPWSVFLFAGAICGYLYMEGKEGRIPVRAMKNDGGVMRSFMWGGAGIILLSFIIEPLAGGIYPTYDYWRFSPSFVLLRLGIVLFLLGGMFFFEQKGGVAATSPVTLVGRESLIVYATHLLLIYGNFGTFNFRTEVNHTFGYMQAFITTAILLVLMYGLALVWSRIKRGERKWKRAAELVTALAFLLVFLFGPGE
ncbi:MAG TPA: heparan-alpha-glucosaminide N-acetyltransferase domain-containing protein [Bacteroidota bacterium]|nr:heparan-alpha-glucosaminide N-acetyltransferase domain-containing protein [Bacteroidota bacterium]